MKILQLGKFYPIRGGVEKVMYDFTEGLGERGIKCDMLCAATGEDAGRVIDLGDSARVICLKAFVKVASTMIAPSMVTYLRKHHDYDIIHIHHPDPMAALALRLSGYSGRVVLHWHSDIRRQKLLKFFYKPLQTWLLERADLIVGTTPVYVRESPDLRDFQAKVTYLPIGVEKIQGDPALTKKLRYHFPNKKIVFALGRFVGYKGFEYLIEAAGLLPRTYHVVIGGEGPLREKMEGLAISSGAWDRVTFLDRIPEEELPSWFEACDVFVLSSVDKTEAFGIVQIEAMSCGKPVVATRIPESGVSWVNSAHKSGLNVPPRSGRELASAIMSVCRDSEKYKIFSRGALERYNDFFTKEAMMDGLIRIYENVSMGPYKHKESAGYGVTMLFQSAINERIADGVGVLDRRQWKKTLAACAAQNIDALVYDSLPEDMPEDIRNTWLRRTEATERRNTLISDIATNQKSSWKRHKTNFVLLKGESMASLYPKPLRRGPGDIDWFFPDRNSWQEALSIAKRNNDGKIHRDSDGDLNYFVKDVVTEHHRDWTHLSSRRLRSRAGEATISGGFLSPEDTLLMLECHIFHHLSWKGTCFKQLADLAFALKNYDGKYDKKSFAERMERIGMAPWSALLHAALMDLGAVEEEVLPIEPLDNKAEVEELICIILQDGCAGTGKRMLRRRASLMWRYNRRETLARYMYLALGRIGISRIFA